MGRLVYPEAASAARSERRRERQLPLGVRREERRADSFRAQPRGRLQHRRDVLALRVRDAHDAEQVLANAVLVQQQLQQQQ